MTSKFLDENLHKRATEMAREVYGDRNSGYRSGYIVKKYKELGGRFDPKQKDKPLRRWFLEEWKNIEPTMDYPVYRPSKRVSKKTPLTVDEIDPKDLKEKIMIKQKLKDKGNLEPFKKNKDRV